MLKMVFCSYCDGVPLKFKKKKRAGLQFARMDYLSSLLAPLRIRWTAPLRSKKTDEVELQQGIQEV
jgi:hypothetical protein